MHLWITAIVLMLFMGPMFAAFIYGDIYDERLERHEDTVVKVHGDFSYQLVTNKANYSLFLPKGEYVITASHYNVNGELELYSRENINVGDEDQKIDLILSPIEDNNWLIFIGALIFIVCIAAVKFFWRNQKEILVKPIKETKELDMDAKNVLRVIESQDNRVTQKELRLALNFSDAKLSLIIAELEQMGKIKKFKKGRGNIIKKI
jgi:uncharacterized membrane protein